MTDSPNHYANDTTLLRREFESILRDHPSEEELEAYAMGRVGSRGDEDELEHIETHLLVCEACQDAVTEIDQFVGTIRRTQPAEEKRRTWGRLTNLFSFPSAMTFVAVAALLSISAPFAAQRWSATGIDTVVYKEAAQRASPEAQVAPAGREFNLDLPAPAGVVGPVRIGVVAADGQMETELTAPVESGRLQAHVSRRLSAGKYWLRLSTIEGSDLGEHALTVQSRPLLSVLNELSRSERHY